MHKILTMKTFFLLLFYSHAALVCNSQDSTTQANVLSVTLSPVILNVPPVRFGVQTGVQYRFKNWGVIAELAVPFVKKHSKYNDVSFVKGSLEVQQFFKKDKGVYVSVQYNYASRNFKDTSAGTFFKNGKSEVYIYTSTSVSSPMSTIVFKGGNQFIAGKKIIVDLFIGIGSQTIMTKYHSTENLEQVVRPGVLIRMIPYSAHYFDETISRLHVTSGLRLLYNFK